MKGLPLSWGGLPLKGTNPGPQHHHQCPPMLAGQGPRAHGIVIGAPCDGVAHCWIVFCVPCDGAVHCWSWHVGHFVKVIWLLLLFCKKKSLFIQLCSWLLAGQPAAC